MSNDPSTGGNVASGGETGDPGSSGGAEPTVVAPGGTSGEGGSSGAGNSGPVEPPPTVVIDAGAGGSPPVIEPASGGQAGAPPVEPEPVPDAGGPVVDPTPRACDYPSLGLEHMAVNTPEFVLWSMNDIGTALRALVVSFPSTPPGCAGATIDASDGNVVRAEVDHCPVSVAGQALVVTGQLEVETTQAFNPGQYPDFVSISVDRRVVRGQAPESTLTFASASGATSFSITSFEFSGESTSTAARLDSISWGAVARYTDGASCRSFDASLSATQLNPSGATSTYIVSANMADGEAGFRFPEARLVGDNPSAYVFITLAGGSSFLRPLNHAALFDAAPPAPDPRVPCIQGGSCSADGGAP